jgi:hypothetical protein
VTRIYPLEYKIKSFAEYLNRYCPNFSVDLAVGYAKKGEEYLKLFCDPNFNYEQLNLSNQNTETIAGCILWCLIKKSYDAHKPFGKGMFNITFENIECTNNLYNFLENSSYARISSHYTKIATSHKGIDDDNSKIKWPWQFKTIVFGMCDKGKDSQSLYFKPERFGLDVIHHPIRAACHLYAWSKFLIHPQRLLGTESYRETDENVLRYPWQQGKEIYFIVDSNNGVFMKEHKNNFNISNSRSH